MKKLLIPLILFVFPLSSFSCELYFGDNISERVQLRLKELLRPHCPQLKQKNTSLIFGSHEKSLITKEELKELKAEAFLIKTQRKNDKTIFSVDGVAAKSKYLAYHQKKHKGLIGAHFGAYALLEKLGFSFLHPLEPTLPKKLKLSKEIKTKEAPRWPIRGIHLHTMHPLELTHLLNGWGPKGPHDDKGWQELTKYWDLYLEWLLANKQNRVQWALLDKHNWSDYAQSEERAIKLRYLAKRAHEYSIFVGVDATIVFEQQNSFRLITERKEKDPEDEIKQLKSRIDWLMNQGFDYISTEMGFSEFTSPDGDKMLEWLNIFADYLKDEWKSHGDVKVHVTKNQKVKDKTDPVSGDEDMNFNFLPHYATTDLGVLVHTVQHYGLRDKAPTYNRKNFKDMYQFLRLEAGKRQTLFYPESSYWVSFDVDVPLFLPVYAHRRVEDLRKIARNEEMGMLGTGEFKGSHMDGQILFSSGWEWGYWLNDVISARASWNPHIEQLDPNHSFKYLLEESLQNLNFPDQVLETLYQLSIDQKELLIDGKTKDMRRAPRYVEKINGQAYMQGWDAWDDLNIFISGLPIVGNITTQPYRYRPKEIKKNKFEEEYLEEVKPLLNEMRSTFHHHYQSLAAHSLYQTHPLFVEIKDAMEITALRAKQIDLLYQSGFIKKKDGPRERRQKKAKLIEANDVLVKALRVVRRREKFYRVPHELINSWGVNPTAYRFGYLWPVKSLLYWFREEDKFVRGEKTCRYNVIDALTVIAYKGENDPEYKKLVKRVFSLPFTDWAKPCLKGPEEEPSYSSTIPDDWRKALDGDDDFIDGEDDETNEDISRGILSTIKISLPFFN